MPISHRSSLAVLALVLFAHGARPVPAQACSWPAPTIWVDDAYANGVVVLTIECMALPCITEEVPDVLPVQDRETGLQVPGEVLRVVEPNGATTKVVWLPDEPLVVGREYEVMWRPAPRAQLWQHEFEFEKYTFAALPEADFDVTLPQFTTEQYTTWRTTSEFFCESFIDNSCGDYTQWVQLEHQVLPAIRARIDEVVSSAGIANAFELRTAFWSDDEVPPAFGEPVWGGEHHVEHIFDAEAERYCYRLELRSLLDDSTAVHEDCRDNTDLQGKVGTFVVTSAEIERSLSNCVEPPAGYETEWCSGTRARCADEAAHGYTGEGCDDVESRCSEFELSEPPAQGPDETEGDPGEPPPAAGDGEDETDDDATLPEGTRSPQDASASTEDDAEPANATHVTSGCAVGHRPVTAPWGALTLATLAVVARIGRRRGRRASSS